MEKEEQFRVKYTDKDGQVVEGSPVNDSKVIGKTFKIAKERAQKGQVIELQKRELPPWKTEEIHKTD